MPHAGLEPVSLEKQEVFDKWKVAMNGAARQLRLKQRLPCLPMVCHTRGTLLSAFTGCNPVIGGAMRIKAISWLEVITLRRWLVVITLRRDDPPGKRIHQHAKPVPHSGEYSRRGVVTGNTTPFTSDR